MIELNELSSEKYAGGMEKAKNQISILTDSWTNTQSYDPGITLIELFAWLQSSQNDYINEVSKSSYYVFLNLIGVKRESNRGSRALLNLKNASKNLIIPKGTKWCSENLVFENLESIYITDANIVKIEFQNSKGISCVEGSDLSRKRVFKIFGELDDINYDGEILFLIYFNRKLMPNIRYSLYFEVVNYMNKERNPILNSEDFISMADIEWQFYGEVNGLVGWNKIKIEEEKTFGFLFSGIIKFIVPGEMIKSEGTYRIRAVLKDQDYDFPPQINDIKINVIEVEQKETICETINIRKKDIDEDRKVKVSTNLSIYGKNECYVRKNNSWVINNQITFERDIEGGSTFFYIPESIEIEDENGFVVRIVCYDKKLFNGTAIGSGTGISLQRIQVKYDDIKYNEFEIMIGRKVNDEYFFNDWSKVESFAISGMYDRHYILNTDVKQIGFGNHEKGMIPHKGEDNIKVTSLSCTKGIDSNIKSHMINKVLTENKFINDLQIEQFTYSTGGFYYETVDDMKRKVLKLFEQGERAVTVQDYERIVRSTPGLIIDNVKIIPSYYPKETYDIDRCVTIVVRGSRKNRSLPLKSYRDNIINNINKYRLINTKIAVVAPTYVGLTITGEIIINSYSREDRKIVCDEVRSFIDKLNVSWGSNFCIGDLFGSISRLDVVVSIKGFHVIPNGDYLKRKSSEDIIAKPNGEFYIENLDLFFRS